jgi:predicted phosphodiesterase
MMATSKERIAEIVDYAILHSDKEACDIYQIKMEVLSRYKRTYKQHFGNDADLLIKIKNQYSTEELKAIANGGRIVPGFQKAPIINFTGDEFTFGVIVDTHIGSIDSEPDYVFKAFEEFEKKGCDFLVHGGDVVEGMMNRPGHIYELNKIGLNAQKEEAVRILSQWTKPSYYISGNHDDSFNTKLNAGIDIVHEICKELPNAHYIGLGEGDISINGIVIRLFHGIDAGASYALSYRPQKIIESWTGGMKPNVLITAHDHKSMYLNYRNCHAIAGGCLQKQTTWMRGRRMAAHTGFWIVKLCVGEGSVRWIEPRFYPLYS